MGTFNKKKSHLRSRWYLRYHRAFDHPSKVRIERWLRFLLGLKKVHTASPSGVLYSAEFGDYVQMELISHGLYEPATLERWNQLLEPGQVVVDVGSHVGQFALHAAISVGSQGRVIAIEPNPRTFALLRANIELNSVNNVVPLMGAVARHRHMMRMRAGEAGNSGGTQRAAGSEEPNFFTLAAPLTEIAGDLGLDRIDLLKIDVEGMETDVLRSLLQGGTISPPRHIIVEMIDELLLAQGSSRSELTDILRANNYQLRTVNGGPFRPDEELPENNLWCSLVLPDFERHVTKRP